MTGYELSKQWFDWSFENPDKTNPNHTALYFFIVEHYNRMGQPLKFGLPMEMAKAAIGIKNYRTYSKTFEDLIEWGFIKVHQRSKNQYSSNVIAIVKNTKAHTKALSKATLKHSQKQVHGIVGISKPITNNLKQETIYRAFEHLVLSKEEFENITSLGYTKTEIDNMLDTIENYKGNKNYKSLNLTVQNWLKKEYPNRKPQVVKPKLHRPPVNRYMSYKDYAEDVKNPEFTEQQYNDELRLMLKDEYKWLHATN